MILENNKSSVETYGEIKEHEVSIDPSNLSHIITILSSNLYSNPEESFLRETISNAWDSHIEAGSKEPVILSILTNSTNSNVTVAIRDYGTGISPERFNEIYLNIGSSTKRASNEYIGAFGIGRFSALSCSDVVNITSYYNGIEYTYIMMKNNDKINIDLINSVPTTEKNGVEVRITAHNYTKYVEAIRKLYYMPNLYINTNLSLSFNERKIFKYKTFYFGADLLDGKSHILLGNVIYDLDLSKFSNYPRHKYFQFFERIEPKFEIGELDVTPNRESLLYSERTINNIEKKLQQVKEELLEIYAEQNKSDFSDFSEYYRIVRYCRNKITLGDPDLWRDIYTSNTFIGETSASYKGEFFSKNSPVLDAAYYIYERPIQDYIYMYDRGIFSTAASKSSHSLLHLIYSSPYWGNTKGFKFVVLPSVDGTRSTYFKQYVKKVYGNNDVVFVTPKFQSIEAIKQYASVSRALVLENGKPNWRKTLWLFKQVFDSLKSSTTYTDIINSSEYIEFKKNAAKEARDSKSSFGKSITVYFTSTGYTCGRSFSDINSLDVYIKGHYNKGTIIKCCRDNYKLGVFSSLYANNEHIVCVSVAKTNIKVLSLFPSNYIDIEEYLSDNSPVYIKFISEQFFLKETAAIRDAMSVQTLTDLVRLAKYLPSSVSDTICWFTSTKRSWGEDIETAISTFNKNNLDTSLFDALEVVKKYVHILTIMSNIKILTNGINDLFAYFGVKNKLFRVDFNQYINIKNKLAI